MIEREPQTTKISVKCNDCSWKQTIRAEGNSGLECGMKYADYIKKDHEEMFDHKVAITLTK
jgi:hypothetical protein